MVELYTIPVYNKKVVIFYDNNDYSVHIYYYMKEFKKYAKKW